jgi:hypothetical protein
MTECRQPCRLSHRRVAPCRARSGPNIRLVPTPVQEQCHPGRGRETVIRCVAGGHDARLRPSRGVGFTPLATTCFEMARCRKEQPFGTLAGDHRDPGRHRNGFRKAPSSPSSARIRSNRSGHAMQVHHSQPGTQPPAFHLDHAFLRDVVARLSFPRVFGTPAIARAEERVTAAFN